MRTGWDNRGDIFAVYVAKAAAVGRWGDPIEEGRTPSRRMFLFVRTGAISRRWLLAEKLVYGL